jgi:50S ribosomal protein L16 3-hydroxylase
MFIAEMIAQARIPAMDIAVASPLLGGLSPQVFMRRHWQKQPLLIRQALPGSVPPVDRAELFALAARDDVESRLVEHAPRAGRCVTGRSRVASCRR